MLIKAIFTIVLMTAPIRGQPQVIATGLPGAQKLILHGARQFSGFGTGSGGELGPGFVRDADRSETEPN